MTVLPAPGPHGGDATAVAHALGLDPRNMLDLSQSLNPMAPDLVRVLHRHLEALGRYPEAAPATAALAEAMGVDEKRVLLTNGGAEAIGLVSAEIGGRVVEPEFSLHPRARGPLWRSNPHSPSGRLAGRDERADVWDEAFYALATGSWTRADTDAVVVGSLTKLLACPGLRIGYILVPEGEPDLIDRCRTRQTTWAVNGLAVSALPELLASVDLGAWSDGIQELRSHLVSVLHGHGLEPQPSDANWVLVEAPGLRDLLAPHGVVVRDCASFAMPDFVRIAVPNAGGLERLDAALGSIDPRAVHRSGPRARYECEPAPRKGTP
jgi:histidinol-phosphate/aromatic aminotransferase/cobyric acid decarboxylase-like protein